MFNSRGDNLNFTLKEITKNCIYKYLFSLMASWTKLRCPGYTVPLVFGKLLCSPFYLLKSEKIISFEILIHKLKIFILFTLKSMFLLFIFDY